MAITMAEFAARLKAAGAGNLVRGLHRLGVGAALEAERQAKLNATTRLHPRTGRLRASIAAESIGRPDGFDVVLRAGGGTRGEAAVAYARIHELGGRVVPRTAKMLRIPLAPALTGAGVDRFPTPLRQSGAGLFVLRQSATGALLLFRRDQPRSGPWYVLKRSVTIPARPYLRPALEAVRDRLPSILADAVRGVVARGSGG